MNIKFQSTMAALAVGFCTLVSPVAKADCGGLTSGGSAQIGIAQEVMTGVKLQASSIQQEPQLARLGGSASIVGLWLTTFTSGGQIVDQGFDAWSSDGIEILNDNPPPATGNVCLGTWVKTGPNSVVLKHPSWTFDSAGNVNGMAIIREQITVDPSGQTFKGTYTVDIVTLNGTPITQLSGTLAGQRVTVD